MGDEEQEEIFVDTLASATNRLIFSICHARVQLTLLVGEARKRAFGPSFLSPSISVLFR